MSGFFVTMKIVLLKSGALGDLIQTTPAVQVLREAMPSAEIDFICPAEYSHVFINNPHISAVKTFSMTNIHTPYRRLSETIRIIRLLRGYDASAVLNIDRRWQMLPLLAGVKRRFCTIQEGHRADDYVRAVTKLTGVEAERPDYSFFPDKSEIALPREKHIAIACGGGRNIKMNSPQKLWDKFPELIETILKHTEYSVALLGDANDSLPVSGDRIFDYTGRTSLSDCFRIIDNADKFLGSDTGLTNLAACTRTPITVLYGATDPAHTAPRHATVIKTALPCAPCETKGRFKCCENRCMKDISADAVFQTVFSIRT